MRRRRRREGILTKIKRAFGNIGTLNIVLLLVFAFFLYFNSQMLQIFREVGAIPETYACAVIAATIGECGICGWIRTTKDKKREHDQEREDLKEDRAWEDSRETGGQDNG